MRTRISIIIYLALITFGYCQSTDKLSVSAILRNAQDIYANTKNYSMTLNYKMFGTYEKEVPMEEFNGMMVKYGRDTFLRIHNTLFLTYETKQTSIKIFEDEKTIEINEGPTSDLTQNSPIYLERFVEQFKYKNVVDKGNYYLCTLTTDAITQFPYGRIELHILKESYVITKQVLYFLAEYPFIDENGLEQKGNPKMVVTLSDFKNVLSKDAVGTTNMSNYIKKSGKTYLSSDQYKDFKIIQN